MGKSRVKPKYTPPKVVELTNFTASGDELSSPMGVCKSGLNPFYSCVTGPGVLPRCEPGGTPDTSSCAGGGYHTYPACDPGGNAVTVCLSGTGQQ